MFIQDENIRIFPTIDRTTTDNFTSGTNWLTQYNICSIVNKLCGVNGFIISEQLPADDITPYEFNIQGFIISLKGFKTILNTYANSNHIYAKLKLDTSTSSHISDYKLLESDSIESNQFGGLELTDSISTSDGYTYLHIASKSSDSWVIPEDSKIKFKTDVLRIDDGVLE